MNKRKIRDSFYLFRALLFSFLYIPHLLCYLKLIRGGYEKYKRGCKGNAYSSKYKDACFLGTFIFLT